MTAKVVSSSGINPHPEMTSGFQVLPEFTVVQPQTRYPVTSRTQEVFWVWRGSNQPRGTNGDIAVRSLDHLNEKIVPFFDKHPLKSKKTVDFIKFRKILLADE